MRARRRRSSLGLVAVVAGSIALGATVAPLPVRSHTKGVNHLWNDHLVALADQRYPTKDQLATEGLIAATSVNADCPPDVNFTGVSTKIADIGTFQKNVDGSTIEARFEGRIKVGTLNANGARFELRIDDALPTQGRATGLLRAGEVGNEGVNATFTGVFSGLSAGTHTLSMWVRALGGMTPTGTSAQWDPGCFSSDHVIVKELA